MKNLSKFVLLVILTLATQSAYAEDFLHETKKVNGKDFAYFVRGAEWLFGEGEEKVIFVCWENPQDEFQNEMDWVKKAVKDSWDTHSALIFKGWQKCQRVNSGIRVLIDDSGPHVKAFGKKINRMQNGMVLNFTFRNWQPDSDVQTNRKKYIVAIAAHEFGHALGFAHEQNRPNTPDKCAVKHGQNQPNEEELTPYDFESVMNYCNKKYANWGKLSDLDIAGVQEKYGKPNPLSQ
ncbi:MAG: M12 family metallopeptidase [Nitrospirales bacterium]